MATDPTLIPDAAVTSGLNKAARLQRAALENAAADPGPLNAPYPFGGVGFPAAVFGAVRSDGG